MENMGKHFMKLINGKSSVFMNMSINLAFQILSADRQVSRSHFIVHICTSPLNEGHYLCTLPFLIHSDKDGD
jgi:hypothetical protein